MIQIVSLHINTDRPQELGQFYQKVLGLEPAWSSETTTGFMVNGFRLEIGGHDQVSGRNQTPARHFFDIMVGDVRAEFERMVELGATAVQPPYEFAEENMKLVIATLADPDGNYFQLISF